MSNEKQCSVCLIYGGRGHESEVSIKGMTNILPLIDKNTYEPFCLFIDKSGRWLIDDSEVLPAKRGFLCPETSKFYRADCAFPLLHGDFGEDGRVQGALECADIPFVGCDTIAGAACRDKSFVKTIAESLGIPTLPHLLLLRSEGVDYAVRQSESSFTYPMFIKPSRLGSSVGIGVAESERELITALKCAFRLCDRVMVEPFLAHKRELECGYFSAKGKDIFTNPGEILLDGTYDYDRKYVTGDTGLAIRADLEPVLSDLVREYSRRLVRALGVRDLSRVDFFLSDGELYFNEINTMPGFTGESLYPKMIETAGFTEDEVINLLIESALRRG